jgi:allantoin racemase
MELLIVNPNTSEEFSKTIRATATQHCRPDTVIRVVNPSIGPRWIDGRYEELLSAPYTVQLILENEASCDGFIIACYSAHIAISAAREVIAKPVVGIAEASMLVATLLGDRFSVVTSGTRWKPLLEEDIARIGLSSRCASVRAASLETADLELMTQERIEGLLLAEAQAAVDRDGAEVICLGCAGMSGFDARLKERLGVPVLDGVVCAVAMVETLVSCGFSTSKTRTFANPGPNRLEGMPDSLSSVYHR